MSKKFWQWKDSVESNGQELVIDGVISDESWWGDEATPKELRDELAEHSGALTVSLNSPGGDVFAGVSMYNALRAYNGTVTIRVDGLAASIASVIAMAGDKIVMSPGSMMMIHKPWTFAMGNSEELDKVKEALDKIEDTIVPIYTARTGKSEEEIKELLAAETWFTPDDAVAEGFADEAIEAKKKSSYSDAISSLFNGQMAYSMSAIKPVMQDMIDKIKAEDVTDEVTEGVEDVSTTEETTEVTAESAEASDEKTESEEEVEEVKEVEADDTTDETEVEEVTETTTEEINNSVEKETKMSETTEIAKAQVIEPQAQADPAAAPKVSVKDYLNTKESMEAFARILEENAASGSAKELAGNDASMAVREAWKNHLEVKLGVTNPEIFLPTPLIQEIEDAFKAGGEIWQRVSKTGMDSFNAAWDAATDPSAEAGRAKGYNREDEEEKAEQELTFANRILRPQFVYKYITLNKEDVKEQRTTGALVRFVLSELPKRIIREIERAIVLGDGRANNSDYKIQTGNPRGFYPILADATSGGTGNVFASLYIPEAGEDHYASVVRAYDLLEAEGTPVLIAKKGYVTDMKLSTNANGGYIFPIGSNFGDILEVDAIVQPDWFNDTTAPNVDAILAVLPRYRVVGDQSVEAFQNFILKTNKNEYLQEIWAGGGLTSRKAAVAIATTS